MTPLRYGDQLVPCDGVAFCELDAVQHQVIAQVARGRALRGAASA